MKRTLKRIKLLNADEVKNDILKSNQLKSILGGYSGCIRVMCKGVNSIGCCNIYECYGPMYWCEEQAKQVCVEGTISYSDC